ncbi:hypothetical protein LJC07_06005 [Christensenellaceae bacterium OttesenSCG-928-L17]|nr:hypothetical protein [Christensenellaceae bacterium OttesenSCG-928-L17]
MTIFSRALLKMTALYSAILLVISIGFSVSMYTIACREIDRERPFTAPSISIINNEEFYTAIAARNDQTKESLLGQIIIINIIVMCGGVCLAYFLARATLDPIQKSYRSQADFVSNASHELRTPLTAISMENEVLLRDSSATKDELKSQVASNLEEVKKLQSLTDTLLELSRSEKTTPKDKEAVIEQIVNILVDNAKKYSPKGSPIKVVRKKTRIDVIDQGPGIAEEDLPHIFERFYRGEKSRTSEGYGLGLSLAQSLASQINARITVKNNKDKGATFSVEFTN